MTIHNAPVSIQARKGEDITLGDLRQLVQLTELEPDDTVIHGTTYIEWQATPRIKSLVVNAGEVN